MALKPFRLGQRKPAAFEASSSAAGMELPLSLVSDGSSTGVEVPVLLPIMEFSHAKAADVGFGAGDGSAGVASL